MEEVKESKLKLDEITEETEKELSNGKEVGEDE